MVTVYNCEASIRKFIREQEAMAVAHNIDEHFGTLLHLVCMFTLYATLYLWFGGVFTTHTGICS